VANKAAIKTRLALPKGKLLAGTAAFLNTIGLRFDDYTSKTRIYRMSSQTMPSLTAKMLNERDIPVQVAIGNYDFGICSSDWLQELQTRFPASRIFKLADLGFDRAAVYLADSAIPVDSKVKRESTWRIVTEYPALAEAAAYKMRLKRFRIFPLWGSADAYPPENADYAVLKAGDESALANLSLKPVRKICDSNACLVANSDSLQAGDFSEILSLFTAGLKSKARPWEQPASSQPAVRSSFKTRSGDGKVWLALADGHQQIHTSAFLEKAGFKIEGYSKDNLSRRPSCGLDWLNIKVIRPQDMPQQVANGNFDLAITGKDWLLDHIYQFPSSPVMELADLGFGWVRIVAVISEDVEADSIEGIHKLIKKGKLVPLRLATEYVNIADKYLRDRHIARYRVIPTWGATEVYLPEDADMLIENTETGQTLARHKLKIVDTLFESTACLIGSRTSLSTRGKKDKIEELVKIFREAAARK
jgi:ATP phosphoribosyltransferase